jgi:hypothetical protein
MEQTSFLGQQICWQLLERYQSKYPNATEVDASGIGNTPYVVDVNNTDYYPLM